jgi:hypothetical protein
MARLNELLIRILTDATGKPYVEIEGADDGRPNQLRMVLHAEDVTVEDLRK